MFHFSYPPSKLENVDYSLFKSGQRLFSGALAHMFAKRDRLSAARFRCYTSLGGTALF